MGKRSYYRLRSYSNCGMLHRFLRNPWLQTLLLEDNSLTTKLITRLLSALEQDKSLQTLSLAQNTLHDSKVTEALRKVFKHNKTLTDLDLK